MLYGGWKQKTAIFFLFRSFNTILELSLISRSCLVSRCLSGACQFVGMYMVGGKSRHNKKTQKKGIDKKKKHLQRKTNALGAGSYSTNVHKGRLWLEVQPLTVLYTIFHKKGTPFVYLLFTNGTPFTLFASLLTAVNAVF